MPSRGTESNYDDFAAYYDLWADLSRVTTEDVAFFRDLASAHHGGRGVELGVGRGTAAGHDALRELRAGA